MCRYRPCGGAEAATLATLPRSLDSRRRPAHTASDWPLPIAISSPTCVCGGYQIVRRCSYPTLNGGSRKTEYSHCSRCFEGPAFNALQQDPGSLTYHVAHLLVEKASSLYLHPYGSALQRLLTVTDPALCKSPVSASAPESGSNSQGAPSPLQLA